MAEKVIEYYSDGTYPNDRFVECRTRVKRDDTVHRVMYYMDLPKNDDESLARYKVPLNDIIALGITTLGYRVNSKAVFDDPSSWDENGKLTTKAVEFIQSDANSLSFAKPEKKTRSKKITINEAKAQIAAEAGLKSYDELMKALANIKKSKK